MEGTESLEKVKKPRSEKQLEAFQKAREKRKENCELMKEVKEQHDTQKKLEQMKIKEELLKKKIVKPVEPDSDSDDEEVVVIRQKKKKKKKVVVVEEESEEEPEVEKVKPVPYVAQTPMPQINKFLFY